MDSQTADYIKLIFEILTGIAAAGFAFKFIVNKTRKFTNKNVVKNNRAGGDIAGGNIYKK